MRDIFELMDGYKFNFLRDYKYLQKIALVFCSIMALAWAALGWDSGVGMIGWGKINYDAYGKTLHFSAFVIYGLLFYGLSRHFEKIGIKHSKNVFYSAFLVLLNISIFEHFYGLCFVYFQRYETNLIVSYLEDLLFWQQYILMLVLGGFTILAVYVDSHIVTHKRLYTFQPNVKILIMICLTLGCALLWIFYPFPITTAIKGNWTSSKFFPQTRYSSTVYVRNDLLHLVNVLTKLMFAFTQFYIISRFKK